MELRQLKYLIAISKEQNINKAAKLCFVTQPALTQQIKKLEDEFNTSLLIRRGRGIILSKEGERLCLYAKEIMNKVDAVKDEFSKTTKDSVDQIYLASVPALYKHINKVSPKLTEMSIKLKKMGDEQLEYELQRGLINAGITAVTPKMEDFYIRTIAREKMYVIASKNELLSETNLMCAQDVKNKPLALLSKELMQREYIESYLSKNNLNAKITLDVTSFEKLIEVVKYSNFISILPYSLMTVVEDFGIQKKEIIDDDFYREIFLVSDEENKSNKRLNVVEDCFCELTKH